MSVLLDVGTPHSDPSCRPTPTTLFRREWTRTRHPGWMEGVSVRLTPLQWTSLPSGTNVLGCRGQGRKGPGQDPRLVVRGVVVAPPLPLPGAGLLPLLQVVHQPSLPPSTHALQCLVDPFLSESHRRRTDIESPTRTAGG